MKNSKLTEQQIKELIQLYQNGSTPKELGEKYNVYNNSIIRILRRNNIARTQQVKLTIEQTQEIIKRYQSGVSSTIIATELNVNNSTICRVLKRNNIDIKPVTITKRNYNKEMPIIKEIDSKYSTTFIPTINGIQLTKENLALMSQEQKDAAAPLVLEYFRNGGFPHPLMSNDDIISSFQNLQQKDITTIRKDHVITITNQAGADIIKHFSPHFWDVKNGESLARPSISEVFHSDRLLSKVIKNRLDQNYQINGNMMRQGMATSKVGYKASIFNVMLAKCIYTIFTKDNDIIYDYSMGFGQRLLGALALPHNIKYLGVDVWDKSVNSNQEIYNFFKKNLSNFKQEVEITHIGSEGYCPTEYHNKVNVAFSSPPYFNVEQYCSDASQAYMIGYDNFINTWWRQTVSNIDKMLTIDGYFILNIKEKVGKFDLQKDMTDIIQDFGFELVDTYKIQLSKTLAFGNRTEHKYEPILVFKRK